MNKLIHLRIPASSEQLATTKGTLSGLCEVTYRLHRNTTSTSEVMFDTYFLNSVVQTTINIIAVAVVVLFVMFIGLSITNVNVVYNTLHVMA